VTVKYTASSKPTVEQDCFIDKVFPEIEKRFLSQAGDAELLLKISMFIQKEYQTLVYKNEIQPDLEHSIAFDSNGELEIKFWRVHELGPGIESILDYMLGKNITGLIIEILGVSAK